MGSGNVKKVFDDWSHLGHREKILLVYMALVSLDKDQPPVYWGGWEQAARAMGLDPGGKAGNAKKLIQRAIAELRNAGAVVSDGRARIGHRARYALALDPAETYVPVVSETDGRAEVQWIAQPRNGQEGDKFVPQEGDKFVPQEGDKFVPKRGTNSYPRGGTEMSPGGVLLHEKKEEKERDEDTRPDPGLSTHLLARDSFSLPELDSDDTSTFNARFDEFWKSYPRKADKGLAKTSYATATTLATHERILGELGALHAALSEDPKHYVPSAATWLATGPWVDEVEARMLEELSRTQQ
ncbi:hypothetical protein SPF06_02530 [Sinomonas sp. JGH33]|uniref:Helix-turn-helix domain-containing protein n=1 Tax=Sinomonas terricola TaxID=3110330 RepID=A0ABU5T1Q4_9MICC|nr:hypothetical protein [Sinomonas sp. JGH33]MEA5453589.1 hypothetical protein [Sinomonas sp. JGH33]